MEQRIISSLTNGQLVECTKEEYPEVRKILHRQAAKYLEEGQEMRSIIALEEVRRLDKTHLW